MKVRTLLILIGLITSISGFAQEKTIKAFYTGFDQENKLYSFEDADGIYYDFSDIKSEVLKKHNLNSNTLIDKAFVVTYTVKEYEDDGDYYEENTIINLAPTTLKRNEEPEDEE